jgi:hypothetical protein
MKDFIRFLPVSNSFGAKEFRKVILREFVQKEKRDDAIKNVCTD